MYKKLLITAVMAAAVFGFASPVSAQGNSNNDDKVTICHRTNSVTNPYRRITVDNSAVDGKGGADHYGEHKGPVPTSQANAQQLKNNKTKWGDIIPPVEGAHGGLNWTTAGQAIYNNNCRFTTTDDGDEDGDEDEDENGSVLGASDQVDAPAAGVSAGFGGGAAGASAGSIAGVSTSLLSLGYGLRRLRRRS